MPRAHREWTGSYYDGRTARREPVTITIERRGLDLRLPDGSVMYWPFEALRQTQGALGHERLRIEFGTDPVEALLVNEEGLADAIHLVAPHAMRTLRPKSRAPRIVAGSVAALATVAALYVWGMPVLTNWVTPRVPVAWERSLGATVVGQLAPAAARCVEPAGHAQLRRIVERLVGAGARSPYDHTLLVLRDTVVNAFAAPGGFIVVNSGLLAAARSPEELAGVLAHEVQHVELRHSTRALIRAAPLRLAVAALSGGGLEGAGTIAATLGMLRFSRAAEEEADRAAMRMLDQANVDPTAIIAFLRELESQHRDGPRLASYLSSHPRTADRIATLEALAARSRPVTRPLLDSASWREVRGMCDAEAAAGGRS